MKKKGFVLPMVVIFGLLLTLTGIAFISLSVSERSFSHREVYPAGTFWIAEAGVEHGKAWLKKHLEDTGSAYSETEPIVLFGEDEPQEFGTGEYEITIHPDPENPASALKEYRVVSLGRVETYAPARTITVQREVNLLMRIESFAKYAYFTNNEYNPDFGQTIWFVTQDVFYGPVHSNSQINIYGSPNFHGRVTSTANSFNYYPGVTSNPVFHAGYELSVDPIDMNKYKNLLNMKNAASAGGIHITGNSTVTINNTSVTYTAVVSGRTRTYTRALSSFNGVIYATGDISVSGTLNGRLSVAAERDMMITNRIQYSVPPDNPACTSMLGLVSGRKMQVSSSTPSNMVIHATLMVFDKDFSVQDYDTGNPKGTLTIWGGILQNYRGPVGTFWANTGQIRSGYIKDYRYDMRVTTSPPPFFPTTGRYEIIRWEESSPS